MMNLYEGNLASKFRADFTHGSSSHGLAFRNWFRGERTDKITPGLSTWGYWAVDDQFKNNYYTFVGNVLGSPSWTTGTVTASGNCGVGGKVAFRFGCDGNPGGFASPTAFNTAIRHGNYDYITDGVANWDGGANHTLKPSMYYSSKPAFFGSCAWPAFGPDLPAITNTLPAKARFEGSPACSP